MSKQLVIFLDIDGTILSRNGIPPANIEAIRRVREMGHLVFINTGRSYACIPWAAFESMEFDGVVSGIGSDVRYHDEVLNDVCLSKDQIRRVCDHYLATDKICVLEGQKRLYYINLKNHEDKIHIKSSDEIDKLYPDCKISKVTVLGSVSESDAEMLKDDFFYISHERYYEFGLKGCSKSVGMKIVLDRLGIPRENCIAIGDSDNDVDMLSFAGISIAMGNAPDSIKQICDYVTDNVDNAGVAAALERFVLKEYEYSHSA